MLSTAWVVSAPLFLSASCERKFCGCSQMNDVDQLPASYPAIEGQMLMDASVLQPACGKSNHRPTSSKHGNVSHACAPASAA